MKNNLNIIMTLEAYIAKPFCYGTLILIHPLFGFYCPFLKIIIMRDIDDVPLIMINEYGQCMWSMFCLKEDTFRVICAYFYGKRCVRMCTKLNWKVSQTTPSSPFLIHPISLNICHGLKAHASIKKMNFHKRVAV